jgi:hypothetical protein
MESVIDKIGVNKADATKNRIRKGGRPKVSHKRREALSVMCNLLEKKIIQVNARNSGRSVSVFLRDLGLNGRVNIKVRSLPRSVLQLIGTLNHTAANLNQIARKRNRGDDLDPVERALLNQEVRGLQSIVQEIKRYMSWSEK